MINNIPVWVELKSENYRVEIDQRYCNTPNDMEQLASSLNDLFEEHKDWKDTRANVNYDELTYCKLCGQKYEACFNLENSREQCNYCGGGKLEYSLKILKEAK